MKKISSPQLIVLLLLSIPFTVFKCFVITKMWALLAVPVGAPQIGMWQAFALCWLAGAMMYDGSSSDRVKDKTFSDILVMQFSMAFGLLFSWGLAALIF